VRLLITGGAGFIGSNFIRHWMSEHPNDEIVNLDLETYAGDRANLADVEGDRRYRFVHGDIADLPFVFTLMEQTRPDVIVNFAAESHNSRAVLDPAVFLRTNAVGTQTLLEAARRSGVQRFHHISTCEVFGDLPLDGGAAFTEETPYRPRTPYNASKAAADMIVRAYNQTFGIFTTVTVCANNYGRWQHPEKVIPLFATNALDSLPLPLYRHSENRREWLHVTDHCRAIEAVLQRGRSGETYNVGSGDERSVEQVADTVLAATGQGAQLKTYVEDRPGHDRRYLLDHSKLERELGWRPKIAFEAGIADTIAWYRDHASWWRPKKERLALELDETAWAESPTR